MIRGEERAGDAIKGMGREGMGGSTATRHLTHLGRKHKRFNFTPIVSSRYLSGSNIPIQQQRKLARVSTTRTKFKIFPHSYKEFVDLHLPTDNIQVEKERLWAIYIHKKRQANWI